MSDSISITQIDRNPSKWVEKFLATNDQKVTNTLQDKITTLYLLQRYKKLKPVTLDEILSISPEFTKSIVIANKQKDQGHKANQLVAAVLLYNLGVISGNEKEYIENPLFNEVFMTNKEQSAGKIRESLSTAAFPPKRSAKSGVRVGTNVSRTRVVEQDGQSLTMCDVCDAAIFNDKGICGSCKEEMNSNDFFSQDPPDDLVYGEAKEDYSHYENPNYENEYYARQNWDNYSKYDEYDDDYDNYEQGY